MSKKLSWVVIDLDCADPQLVPTHSGTFVRATLTWDGEDTAEVWYECSASDLYIQQDRKILVVELDAAIKHQGYAYLDTVVSGIGKVYHIYQDVVRPDPVEPKKIEDKKATWGSINYRAVVAQGLPANVVFTVEANTPGIQSFLTMFTSYEDEVTNRLIRRLRDHGGTTELTCVGDNEMYYISIERVAEQ